MGASVFSESQTVCHFLIVFWHIVNARKYMHSLEYNILPNKY